MAKKSRKKEGLSSWGLLILGFVVGVALVMAAFRFGLVDVKRFAPDAARTARYVPPPSKPVEPPPLPPVAEEVDTSPRLAIVIDDMGPDLEKLRQLMDVGGIVTVAVMPHQRFSKETADTAYENGLDVLMHLPMEPKDMKEHNPGNGALLVAMTPPEVRAQMEDDLTTIPHAIGINNHMGSRFTENEPLMGEVLDFVRSKDLFFLDSRTTAHSVAIRLATEMGVNNAGRNVFLDNTREVGYIKKQLSQAVAIARKRGKAIAIGHPYPETIQALRESLPELAASGVRVVRLSDVIEEGR